LPAPVGLNLDNMYNINWTWRVNEIPPGTDRSGPITRRLEY